MSPTFADETEPTCETGAGICICFYSHMEGGTMKEETNDIVEANVCGDDERLREAPQ